MIALELGDSLPQDSLPTGTAARERMEEACDKLSLRLVPACRLQELRALLDIVLRERADREHEQAHGREGDAGHEQVRVRDFERHSRERRAAASLPRKSLLGSLLERRTCASRSAVVLNTV